MKSLIWIPFVFFAGLLIGYSGLVVRYNSQKSELEKLRKATQIFSNKKQDLGSVIDFLHISRDNIASPQRFQVITNAAHRNIGSNTGETVAVSTGTVNTNFPNDNSLNRRSLKEIIEDASEVWRARSDIARTAFVKANRLDAEKTAKFDVIVEAMNMRLEEKIKVWADYLSTNDITPETGIRIVNDLSEIMVITYDEMDRNMPEGWRENAGKDFDLGTFIDPAVATPLIDLEPKFRERHSFHPARGSSEWRRGRRENPFDAR